MRVLLLVYVAVSARVRSLLEAIQDMTDETQQMIALTELCEMLSMGTEETLQGMYLLCCCLCRHFVWNSLSLYCLILSLLVICLSAIRKIAEYSGQSCIGFPSEQVVPVLVNLMNTEYNPDLMLVATRTLTHMMEALPATCSMAVAYQAVPSLCAKLLTIEYIDLAEQSLTALEKLSQDHGYGIIMGICVYFKAVLACLWQFYTEAIEYARGRPFSEFLFCIVFNLCFGYDLSLVFCRTAIVRAGGLSACLSYLDFFSTSLQRVSVTIAANICRNIPPDCFHMVYDMVPNLTNILQYQGVLSHQQILL